MELCLCGNIKIPVFGNPSNLFQFWTQLVIDEIEFTPKFNPDFYVSIKIYTFLY